MECSGSRSFSAREIFNHLYETKQSLCDVLLRDCTWSRFLFKNYCTFVFHVQNKGYFEISRVEQLGESHERNS